MKKQILLIGIIIICWVSTTLWRSYPIQQVSNEECKEKWIPCTYDLPRIEDANYIKYKSDKTYRETYSMLRSTTYYDGWDIWLWGHQGIDIATDTWTPVFSTEDGSVIFAGEKGWRWYTITIKHIIDGKTIYSSYAHLSEILVKVGDEIKENWLIWKVGSTWNSTGPHLHFQIEINDDNNHPFFYRNCLWEIPEIVNEWRCIEQMFKNTIDPILFIEKNGNIPILKDKNNNKTFTNTYNSYKNLLFSWFAWGILDKNTLSKIIITPKINSENILVLEDTITLKYDKNIIKILPDSFNVIKNKQILIIPQKTGFTTISFVYKNKVFKKLPIIITDPKFLIDVKTIFNKNPDLFKSLFL